LTNEISKLKEKIKQLEVDELDYGNKYTTQPNKTGGYKKKRNLSQNFTSKNKNLEENFYADNSDDSSKVR